MANKVPPLEFMTYRHKFEVEVEPWPWLDLDLQADVDRFIPTDTETEH